LKRRDSQKGSAARRNMGSKSGEKDKRTL